MQLALLIIACFISLIMLLLYFHMIKLRKIANEYISDENIKINKTIRKHIINVSKLNNSGKSIDIIVSHLRDKNISIDYAIEK